MLETRTRRHVTTVFVWLTALIGLGLAGYGTYLHFDIASAVSTGQCDGGAPWHPLFVVAPILVGLGLVFASVAIQRYR